MNREPLPPPPDDAPQPGTVWKHHKGGEYEVVTVARAETAPDTFLVVYRSLQDDEVWARTLDNFTSTVPTDDGDPKTVTRFAPATSDDAPS